jgi:hypothetical protein
MLTLIDDSPGHQIGEGISPVEVVPPEVVSIQTPSGQVSVAWEPGTATSVHGMAVFFIEFLHLTGLWAALRDRCPLKRTSPNAPDVATVVGTMLLSILSGGNRYRHIETLRGDGVTPDLLGMDRILSTDALRRAVQDIAEDPAGQSWVSDLLMETLLPVVTKAPWILDLDSTVVTVYGKQGGTAVGYNPMKKGRPSYSYHSFIIGGLRLPLDVEARPGNESHGAYGAECLWNLLDHRLPKTAQPWCIRGDISYGNETIISGCEDRQRDYLFKVRKSQGIKSLIAEFDTADHVWHDAGQGWQGRETKTQLSGWTAERRTIILRRFREKSSESNRKLPHQNTIFIADLCPDEGCEYAVLVTSLKHPISTIAQFYRDRADCENTFADLKNDWSWGGFTTQNQGRNQLMARLIALVYAWWNVFVRQVSPTAHREGHVSRPVLLHGVARRVTHAGKTILRVTCLHAKAVIIMAALSAVAARIKELAKTTATQLDNAIQARPWNNIISAIFDPLINARMGPMAQAAIPSGP